MMQQQQQQNHRLKPDQMEEIVIVHRIKNFIILPCKLLSTKFYCPFQVLQRKLESRTVSHF